MLSKITYYLLCFKEEVVKAIHVDIEGRRTSSQETRPLPAIVFSVEKEICADDSNAYRDYG